MLFRFSSFSESSVCSDDEAEMSWKALPLCSQQPAGVSPASGLLTSAREFTKSTGKGPNVVGLCHVTSTSLPLSRHISPTSVFPRAAVIKPPKLGAHNCGNVLASSAKPGRGQS